MSLYILYFFTFSNLSGLNKKEQAKCLFGKNKEAKLFISREVALLLSLLEIWLDSVVTARVPFYFTLHELWHELLDALYCAKVSKLQISLLKLY